MKKAVLPLFLILALLCACAPASSPPGAVSASAAASSPAGQEDAALTVLATTYPVYLFAAALTDGVAGIELSRLDTGGTSCLHDYTLTVNDMKLLERADLIALNGAGLEDFMAPALTAAGGMAADCSAGISLLVAEDHAEHHDHSHDGEEGHFDPHIWLDPMRASRMADNLCAALVSLDPGHQAQYEENAAAVRAALSALDARLRADLAQFEQEYDSFPREIITFHNGFQYLADAYGFTIVKSIEEEEGSTASAREIEEILSLIKTRGITVIFTEISGYTATAETIAREVKLDIAPLSMIMDGTGTGLEDYEKVMLQNIHTLGNYLCRATGR